MEVTEEEKMSDIKNIIGKSKEYTIMSETFTLKPLSVKNIDILMDMQSENTKTRGIKNLLVAYIKQAFPEATNEEREDVGLDFMNKLMDAAMDVNGLNNEEPK